MALTREIRVIGGSLAFTEPVSANSRPAASFADNNSCASIWAASRRHLRANLYAAGHHHRNVVSARRVCDASRTQCACAGLAARRGTCGSLRGGCRRRRGYLGRTGGGRRSIRRIKSSDCGRRSVPMRFRRRGSSSGRRRLHLCGVDHEAFRYLEKQGRFAGARLVKKPGSRARVNVYPEDKVRRVAEELRAQPQRFSAAGVCGSVSGSGFSWGAGGGSTFG